MPYGAAPDPGIPAAERGFFVEEFRGITIVVSLPELGDDALRVLARTVSGFGVGDTRFVMVVGTDVDARRVIDAVDSPAALVGPTTVWDDAALARLWVTATDHRLVVALAGSDQVAETSGFLAAGLGASKVVLTDPGGGWGSPARSFADLQLLRDPLSEELTRRGVGNLVPAAETALRGGAYSVNICRAEDLELELFTFDGAGTLITHGGYVQVTPLRVDDLAAVERLVGRGVADGVLRPRLRAEIARMAVGGLGARVVRTGHLAGVVGLESEAYGSDGVGEVSGLITVSQFSGAGAGGMLLDALAERAHDLGLRALFAVTVSAEAATFFARHGYHEVPREAVPASKWVGYDPQRLDAARCFWRDVA